MNKRYKLGLYAVELIIGVALVILAIWLGGQYLQKAMPFGEGALGFLWTYTGWIWSIALALAGVGAVEHAI